MSDNEKPKQPENKGNQLNLELTPEIAEGIYSNLVMIGHSNSEFVVDFIRMLPGLPQAKVKSRIILTPEHAARLLETLKDNIAKYENSFGEIKASPEPPKIPLNFGGPIGEA